MKFRFERHDWRYVRVIHHVPLWLRLWRELKCWRPIATAPKHRCVKTLYANGEQGKMEWFCNRSQLWHGTDLFPRLASGPANPDGSFGVIMQPTHWKPWKRKKHKKKYHELHWYG